MALHEKTRQRAFGILDRNYGSPENMRRGLSDERAMAFSSGLLASHLQVKISTAQKLVREWVALREKS
jgi:hypothetical protein